MFTSQPFLLIYFLIFYNSRNKKGTRFLRQAPICYLIVRFDFWRKWRKFGVNPLLRAPKIKDSCGFWAVISTCRPFLYTVHVVVGS
jgi:hypothetical protein